MKFKIPGLVALSLATLAFMSFQIPVLQESQLDTAIRNAAHAPLFGVLTYLWLWLVRPGVAVRWLILALLLLALSAEMLEGLVYNGWSLIDLSGNLLGVLLGFAVWKLADPSTTSGRARISYLLVAVAVLSVTVFSPVAFALHRVAEQNRWYPILLDPRMRSARPEVAALASYPPEFAWTDAGLEIQLPGEGIRGIALAEFVPDWTRNTTLVLDVENPSTTPFRFEMHIRDREGSAEWEDRFNHEEFLQPGTRTKIRIPLQDIGNAPSERAIDLSKIAVIAIYSGAASSDSIILRRISLE